MTICIFPGSFNPIHNAHIRVAEFALKNYGFEKVIFVPAYIPPHKDIDKNLATHRLNMVKLATELNQRFEVSDFEYQNENASYSLITVRHIIDKYKLNDKLNFLIGTDAFEKLNTWYKTDELKKLVHFIVYPRAKEIPNLDYYKNNGYDFEINDMKFYDISSTNLRNNLTEDVPNKVKEYIEQHDLYKY